LCNKTYRQDGYLNIYFHPWEFTDLRDKTRFGFPGYVSKNSGSQMSEHMDQLIAGFKQQKRTFATITQFLIHNQLIAPVQAICSF
jgi:hypothetical protein